MQLTPLKYMSLLEHNKLRITTLEIRSKSAAPCCILTNHVEMPGNLVADSVLS